MRQLQAGDRRVEALQLPELPGRISVQGDPQDRRGRSAQAAGQVHSADDDRREVHAQHRLPGHDERSDGRGLLEVPHPADVRAGVSGQDVRRRLGALDEHAGEADLREVEAARKDLKALVTL